MNPLLPNTQVSKFRRNKKIWSLLNNERVNQHKVMENSQCVNYKSLQFTTYAKRHLKILT